MSPEGRPDMLSYALPLGFSLVTTGLFAFALSQFPSESSLSVPRVLTLALVSVVGSAVVHMLSVSIAFKAFSNLIQVPLANATRLTWLIVAWVPVAVLLAREESPWLLLLLPAVVSFPVVLWGRLMAPEASDRSSEPVEHVLFRSNQKTNRAVNLWAVCAVAVALEGTVIGYASTHYTIAACLLAGCPALPLWVLRPNSSSPRSREILGTSRLISATTSAVLLLTILTLMPFAKHGNVGGRIANLLGIRKALSLPHLSSSHRATDTAFESIVLIVPKKPNELFRPINKASGGTIKIATKPLKINFDGVYWYFEVPDVEPSKEARKIHSDPLKAGIHSVDRWPIRMEAHQYLPTAIDLACCHEIDLNVTDGDHVPGEIFAEVILSDGRLSISPRIALGEKVLPSSRDNSLNRPQVDETLIFKIPARSTLQQFNQITIRVIPAREREVAAPNVAIRSFVLVP